jgi:hypothetical protein
VGKFFQAVFNADGHAVDRVVDGDPSQWGKRIAGHLIEDPAAVLPGLDPADTVVLVFALEQAAEIRRAIAGFGPFPVLAIGDLVRTTSPLWSDYQARRDMSLAIWEEATRESAAFVQQRMKGAKPYWDPLVMLRDMVALAPADGLDLEFGVAGGTSLRVLAEGVRGPAYGFDSFQGLPEDWNLVLPKGAFSQAPPADLPENARLVTGWFEDTLPAFAAGHPGPVAFLHVDCDLYSSTCTIFRHLGERIVPGTVIVFDDYLNFPDWQACEFKAFAEFTEARALRFEYLGVVMNGCQAAVRILP